MPAIRTQISFVIAALIAAALVYGFWPRARPVEIGRVEYGPLKVTVEQEGETRVIDRFVISAPAAGYAQRISLKVGAEVKRGDPLVELEPLRSTVLDPRSRAEAQARADGAQAAVRAAEQRAAAARTEAELARREHLRIRDLAASQLASRQQQDEAQARMQSADANLRSAGFAVEVARFELRAARSTLEHSAATTTSPAAERVRIASPVDGRVLKLFHESEGVVGAGDPLLELGDPRSLEVVADVLSADAVRIRPGSRVRFERWGGEAPLEGRVRLVEPAGFTKISALGVEEKRVNVISDFVAEPVQWERLGDGYRVEAGFVVWESERVLLVPAGALFRVGGRWAVFAVEHGAARQRLVHIGMRNGLAAQVLDGLSAREEVILHPDDTIREGVSVRAG